MNTCQDIDAVIMLSSSAVLNDDGDDAQQGGQTTIILEPAGKHHDEDDETTHSHVVYYMSDMTHVPTRDCGNTHGAQHDHYISSRQKGSQNKQNKPNEEHQHQHQHVFDKKGLIGKYDPVANTRTTLLENTDFNKNEPAQPTQPTRGAHVHGVKEQIGAARKLMASGTNFVEVYIYIYIFLSLALVCALSLCICGSDYTLLTLLTLGSNGSRACASGLLQECVW